MLFYLLLIACAVPMVFLMVDFYNQHKASREKLEEVQSRLKEEGQNEAVEEQGD